MDLFYWIVFLGCTAIAGAFELSRFTRSESVGNDYFKKFRNNYLVIYSLMMAGDWLQGPYVYQLYLEYEFDRGAIGQLFIAGFGSSMVFGTLVGSMADKVGRKKAALLYCLTYMIGCVTKHYNNFHILFVGRIFCGVATSLLYSAFETWVVSEHFKRGFNGDWLGNLFSNAVFLGNGLMAVVAGQIAQVLVSWYQSNQFFAASSVAPFDAAFTVLAIGAVIIALTWSENYGDSTGRTSLVQQFQKASSLIYNDSKIAMLGIIQGLFEGSMYTFVFLWTPALKPHGEDIPFGMIFSTFMVACMAGSAYAGKLLAPNSGYKPEKYMQIVFMVASAALFVPVLFHLDQVAEDSTRKGMSIGWQGQLQLVAFCVFEAAVGVFWPSMMKMRSEHVPEELRATILNFFRIPLNLFVCVVLYNVSKFPLAAMFGMCSLFLAVCMLCQSYFVKVVTAHAAAKARSLPQDEEEPLVKATDA